MKHFFKIFSVFFLLFTLILGIFTYFYFEKDEQDKTVKVKTETQELDIKEKKERVNILLMGIDALDGNYEGNKSRTDTMMILSIDPKTDTAFMLSIPRDSRVKIRGRQGMDKINHAHAYGGVDLALKTAKDLLQIPIHHYIRVDYKALFKTIDDIGGVEIDVPMNMKYSDPYATPPLSINLKKGKQILDGQKSMEYLRYRKGYSNQDLGRINAQQLFLQAVIEKVMSPSSIIKVPQYIETMYMYVDTDMSKKDMLDLAKDAIKIDPKKIQKQTVPGESTTISGISYYKINDEDLQSGLKYLLDAKYPSKEDEDSSDTLEGEKVESDQQNVSVPEIIKEPSIVILNGSGRNKVATRASDLLKIADYKVSKTGNADNFNYDKTTIFYKDDKQLANSVMKALGKGKLVNEEKTYNSAAADILIIIGKDF